MSWIGLKLYSALKVRTLNEMVLFIKAAADVVCHVNRERLEGQRDGDGWSEGHCGQTEERHGQFTERGHGEGSAVFCPQSETNSSFVVSVHTWKVILGNIYWHMYIVLMCLTSNRNRWPTWQHNRRTLKRARRRSEDSGPKLKPTKGKYTIVALHRPHLGSVHTRASQYIANLMFSWYYRHLNLHHKDWLVSQ